MVKTNRGNLVGLNRKKIEVRYDPDDSTSGAWAIDPYNNQAISLTPVTPIPMLDDTAASQALEWKRHNMNAVSSAYHSMATQTPVLFEPEKFKELKESHNAALVTDTEYTSASEMSSEEFRSLVAAKITVEPNIRERAKIVYLTPRDRYEALLTAITQKEKVSAADLAFMADFEENMTDGQAEYFAGIVKMNNNPQGV
jgi:putative transposase